jgi:response regulator RpfG family c-di-GMP phosphodiesterase
MIGFSGVDDLGSVASCIEMGAEDYLFKPLNKTLLNARINADWEKSSHETKRWSTASRLRDTTAS